MMSGVVRILLLLVVLCKRCDKIVALQIPPTTSMQTLYESCSTNCVENQGSKIHQPEIPMSCNRLTLRARLLHTGANIRGTIANKANIGPKVAVISGKATTNPKRNIKNHKKNDPK